MTPGILAAFFLLLGQFYGPVQQLSGIVDSSAAGNRQRQTYQCAIGD